MGLRHFVPRITEALDLGTLAKRWRSLYAKNVYADQFIGSTTQLFTAATE